MRPKYVVTEKGRKKGKNDLKKGEKEQSRKGNGGGGEGVKESSTEGI